MKIEHIPQQTTDSKYWLDLAEQYPNEITRKTIEEIERGENLHGPFMTIKDLMEALNAPD